MKKDKEKELQEYIDIQREVICDLKKENKLLWENMERMVRSLIETQECLMTYRQVSLDIARRRLESWEQTDCTAGCTKHGWDDIKGWYRK